MNYDKYIESNEFLYDESSGQKTSLRQDNELFNDSDNIPGSVVRVKRTNKDSENWTIFKDGKEFLVLKGQRFSAKEKEFLRTSSGVLFIINGIKSGLKTIADFKREISDQV
jgi:hypothetical protein